MQEVLIQKLIRLRSEALGIQKKGMIMSITFFDYLSERLTFDRTALKPWRYVNLMQLVWQVRRERNQLAALSRDELAEMGIHPGDAKREATRGLFDLPKSRLGQL